VKALRCFKAPVLSPQSCKAHAKMFCYKNVCFRISNGPWYKVVHVVRKRGIILKKLV